MATAAAVVAFCAACLTANPTVFPFLVVPLLVWVAIAVAPPEAARGTWNARVGVLNMAAAAVVGVAMLATLAGSWAHDRAVAAAAAGDESGVITELRMATALDPSFALYHRELGTRLQATGDLESASRELATALRLNPSDPAAYRASALVLAANDHAGQAVALATRLVEIASTHPRNALTLALVEASTGDKAGEREALVTAVRVAPWITADPAWRVPFPR